MSSWGTDPNSADQKPKYLLDNEVTKYRREDSYASIEGWVMRAGSPATGNGNINASPEILVAIGGLSGIAANAGFKLEIQSDFPEGGGILLDSTDGTANAGDDLLLEMGDGLGTPTITDIRIISGIPTIDHFLQDTSGDENDAILLDSTNGTANAGDDLLLEAGDGLGTPTITDIRIISGIPTIDHMLLNASDGTGTDDGSGQAQTVEVEITWDESITVAGSPQVTLVNGNEGTGSGRACVLTYTATGSSANRKRFTAVNIEVSLTDVLTYGAADQLALNSGTLSDTEMGGTSVPAFIDISGFTAITQTIVPN
jgi:hypothetical protein